MCSCFTNINPKIFSTANAPSHSCLTYHRNTDSRFLRVSISSLGYCSDVDYLDDKPSISLTGIIPNAIGDVSTPPRGRGVEVADLRDLDARRRFGLFGKVFVERERLRQSRSAGKTVDPPAVRVRAQSISSDGERERVYGSCCVTQQFIRMYNV